MKHQRTRFAQLCLHVASCPRPSSLPAQIRRRKVTARTETLVSSDRAAEGLKATFACAASQVHQFVPHDARKLRLEYCSPQTPGG